MIYDYENETHGVVHVVMLKVCHICYMFGVESTQSYQLTEFRFRVQKNTMALVEYLCPKCGSVH